MDGRLKAETIEKAVGDVLQHFKKFHEVLPEKIILTECDHSDIFKQALEIRINNMKDYSPEIIISNIESGYIIDVGNYLKRFY